MRVSPRIQKLPPYLFLALDQLVARERSRGRDIINLGIGDPDLPTIPAAIHAMKQAVENPDWHRYPDYMGSLSFRQAIAHRYQTRFNVTLDPMRQVLGLIGSKEGLAHLTWAFAGPDDVVLVPDPAYPVYATQARLAGAAVHAMPLRPGRKFLPDLDAIPDAILQKASMLWLNYPNNPTGATAPLEFYRDAVALCRYHNILLCSDLAYGEIGFDGYQAPSVLMVNGAEKVAIEFYSLSKTFNMTGWRIAAAVGAEEAIQALGSLKSQLDSGPFTAIQEAAVAALSDTPDAFIHDLNGVYVRRRARAISGLQAMQLLEHIPNGGFYVWFHTPDNMSSSAAAEFFIEEAGVALAPGNAYGSEGEGWLRLSLTIADDLLDNALLRMQDALTRRK